MQSEREREGGREGGRERERERESFAGSGCWPPKCRQYLLRTCSKRRSIVKGGLPFPLVSG